MGTLSARLRRCERIVRSNPPTRRDFTSNAARGRPLPPGAPPEVVRLWDGLSVYETAGQARRHAKASPMLGGYVAALDLPATAAIRCERTTRSRGHYTLWGEPDALLGCVSEVIPVERAPTRETGR